MVKKTQQNKYLLVLLPPDVKQLNACAGGTLWLVGKPEQAIPLVQPEPLNPSQQKA